MGSDLEYTADVPVLKHLHPRFAGTNLHGNRPALQCGLHSPPLEGGNPCGSHPERATDPGSRRNKQSRSDSRVALLDGPQGGRILSENERGPPGS